MPIRITEDEDEGGGYVFVDLGRPAPSPLLSFRRQDTEPRHLGTDGWQPEVAWLAPLSVSERDERAIARFGPNVVDRIEELVPIEIVAQDGTSFGTVSWPFVTPAPAGRGILAGSPTPPPNLVQTGAKKLDGPPAEEPALLPEPEPAAVPDPAPENLPPPDALGLAGRRAWPIVAMLLALAATAGGGAYVYRDLWLPNPAGPPSVPPVPPAVPEAPRLSSAELRQRYTRLLDERAAAPAFLALGETALASRQGGTAFRAFEEADPVANADAAWQLARFYDPANGDAAYREATRPNVVRAAYYYALWRNRSPRHTEALRWLCEAQADLVGRDDRLRAICRP